MFLECKYFQYDDVSETRNVVMSYICSQLLRASQYNKIVFLYLHFVVYSHLIYSIRGLMFQVKIENVKILYFLSLFKSALSNMGNKIWHINLCCNDCFKHCASLYKSLCRQLNMTEDGLSSASRDEVKVKE
jgi:hypothetical protein